MEQVADLLMDAYLAGVIYITCPRLRGATLERPGIPTRTGWVMFMAARDFGLTNWRPLRLDMAQQNVAPHSSLNGRFGSW